MSKLSLEFIKSKLIEEDAALKVKIEKTKLASKKMEQVGKVSFEPKLTKIKQVDVPAKIKLKDDTSNKGGPGYDMKPADKMAEFLSDEVPAPKYGKSEGKEPKKPTVESAPKPNQSGKTSEVKNPIKNTEGGVSKKTMMPKAPFDDAIKAYKNEPRGIKSGSSSSSEMKTPKSTSLNGTTAPKSKEFKAKLDRDLDGKKVAQVKEPSGEMPKGDGAPGKIKFDKAQGNSINLVESGVVVKVGGKTKVVFDVVSRDVLKRIAESYSRFEYEVTFERTNDVSWKKDSILLKLLRESFDAKYNFVPTQHKKLLKDALNRFHSITKSSYNDLYESRQDFAKVVKTAFDIIVEKAEQKYLNSLNLFTTIARFKTTEGSFGDAEIVTEATDEAMALRQVSHTILETYGVNTEIKHIFVDGKKYLPSDIKVWKK